MFLSLRLLCQILAAITFVQASRSSSKTENQNGSKPQLLRFPQWKRNAAVNPTTSSNGPSIPTQHVELDVSTPKVVQECANGTGSVVVQDCTCSTQQLAAGAINDAITMVQAVNGVWNDPGYAPILQQYMGALGNSSCQTVQASNSIEATLGYLASILEYQWLPYGPNWLTNPTGNASELSAYCAAGVPPQQPSFTATCDQNAPFGWVYTTQSGQKFLGFCTSNLAQQGFVSRTTMLQQLKSGKLTLSNEGVGNNYGRAALSLLAQLVPSIWDQGAPQFDGYQNVLDIAKDIGCAESKSPPSSLINGDSWALWISTLYFAVQINAVPNPNGIVTHSVIEVTPTVAPIVPIPTSTPTTTAPGLLPIETADSNCKDKASLCHNFVDNGDCTTAADRYDDNTMYTQYTAHWFNTDFYEGCRAVFECSNGYPAGGISGADIKQYFAEIYTPKVSGGEGCGICGKVSLSNGCDFTYHECDIVSCKTCNGTDCHHP